MSAGDRSEQARRCDCGSVDYLLAASARHKPRGYNDSMTPITLGSRTSAWAIPGLPPEWTNGLAGFPINGRLLPSAAGYVSSGGCNVG